MSGRPGCLAQSSRPARTADRARRIGFTWLHERLEATAPGGPLAAARGPGCIGGRRRHGFNAVSLPLWLAAFRSREHRHPASAGASQSHEERASLPVNRVPPGRCGQRNGPVPSACCRHRSRTAPPCGSGFGPARTPCRRAATGSSAVRPRRCAGVRRTAPRRARGCSRSPAPGAAGADVEPALQSGTPARPSGVRPAYRSRTRLSHPKPSQRPGTGAAPALRGLDRSPAGS